MRIDSGRDQLIAYCSAQGCARRGMSLTFQEWKDGIVTDKLTDSWSARGVFNWGPPGIVFRPHRMSIAAAIRKLHSATHLPWRALCARCLAARYLDHVSPNEARVGPMPWAFQAETLSSLLALAGRNNKRKAIDQLLPMLEDDLVSGISAQWGLPEGVGR